VAIASADILVQFYQGVPANALVLRPLMLILHASVLQASTGKKLQEVACAQLRSRSIQVLDAPALQFPTQLTTALISYVAALRVSIWALQPALVWPRLHLLTMDPHAVAQLPAAPTKVQHRPVAVC